MSILREVISAIVNLDILAATAKQVRELMTFFFDETLLQHRHTTYNTKASLLQKIQKKTKNYTTYNTIACATTYNAKTNTTHNYLHYNCKTTHTQHTHSYSGKESCSLGLDCCYYNTTGATCQILVIETTII